MWQTGWQSDPIYGDGSSITATATTSRALPAHNSLDRWEVLVCDQFTFWCLSHPLKYDIWQFQGCHWFRALGRGVWGEWVYIGSYGSIAFPDVPVPGHTAIGEPPPLEQQWWWRFSLPRKTDFQQQQQQQLLRQQKGRPTAPCGLSPVLPGS